MEDRPARQIVSMANREKAMDNFALGLFCQADDKFRLLLED